MLNRDYKILYDDLKIIYKEHRLLNSKLMQENKHLLEEIKAYQCVYFDKVTQITKALDFIELELKKGTLYSVNSTDKLLKILRGDENV